MACARAAAAYRARAWTRTGGTADRSMRAHPQGPDLLESLQGLDQAGDADPGRGAAEPLQGRLPGHLVGDQQASPGGPLAGASGPVPGCATDARRPGRGPGPPGGPAPSLPGSRTLRSTSRAVARSKRTLGRSALTQARLESQRDRAAASEPSVEVAVAIAPADLGGVVPSLLARGVALQATRCRRCPVAWRGGPRRPVGPRRGRPGRCPGTAPCRAARRSRGGCDRPGTGR